MIKMNQTEKNNILHEIRDMREKKLAKFGMLEGDPNLSSEYIVGQKHGINMTCRFIEEYIKSL